MLEIWFKEVYPKIVEDLKLDPEKDRYAARLIYELGREKLLSKDVLKIVEGKDVVVIGGAVKLEELRCTEGFFITAGKSILKVMDFLIPKIHVTDMEEGPEVLSKLEDLGTILVLHAHGDNLDLIREIVPNLKSFVASTQVEPFDKVYNFLGFTDGDRAAMIAKIFGARSIRLIGFNFDEGSGVKIKKLKWAKYILSMGGIL